MTIFTFTSTENNSNDAEDLSDDDVPEQDEASCLATKTTIAEEIFEIDAGEGQSLPKISRKIFYSLLTFRTCFK